MAIQQFTQAAQIAYAEVIKSKRTGEIDQIIFPNMDQNDGAEIELDQYLIGSSVMRVARSGQPSNVKVIQGGTRTSHVPPTHSEKVVVDQALRDVSIAGTPASNYQATMDARINQILNGPSGFFEQWLAARRMATCQFLATGKINFYDSESASYVEYDLSRKSALTFNYNLSTAGNSFDKAVQQIYTEARKNYCPTGGLCLILGSNWLRHFESSDQINKKRQATQSMDLIQMNLVPQELNNIEGLYIVSRYRVDGVSMPFWILLYEPNQLFLDKSGGTVSPYIGDNQMMFFSLNSGGYRFYRGVDFIDSNDQVMRASGGLVFDSYTMNDPIAEVFRAQSRFFYLPANINHFACVTGSNF